MCTSHFIQYTCGCKKEMEFVQCEGRQNSNVKCHPVEKKFSKEAPNYCSDHLVKPDAPAK